MNRDAFAKKVEFRELPDKDIDGIYIIASFSLKRVHRVTNIFLREVPKGIDRVKEEMSRAMFRELYGQHRERFYELINDLKLNLNAPPSEIYSTLEKLKSLVD